MNARPELQPVSNSAAVWQHYDPAVKAELWSTAIRTTSGVYLIDPTAADRQSLDDFIADSSVEAIVVTNENHMRDALSFELPVFARFSLTGDAVTRCESLTGDIDVVEIDGAPAGEIALVSRSGELVIGDALINFEPYGFTFLPDRYCTDAARMRQSLRRLLACRFDRIFFAHGTPIVNNARERLESLLASA